MTDLLPRITAYIREHGMAPTRFGRAAVNDPRLVGDLRNGRELGPKLTAKVEAYLASSGSNTVGALVNLDGSILLSALAAGRSARIESSTASRWATSTFTGARHQITLKATASAALDAWLGQLPDADLTIRGHVLADIVVTAITRADGIATVRLEALTVEE